MARHRHLNRAPLREALIDVQFSPPLEMPAVERAAHSFGPHFSKRVQLWESKFQLRAGASTGAVATSAPNGVRFDSESPPAVLQCRVNEFTFSRLPPYTEWEDLLGRAEGHWAEFQAIARPETVVRLAVRYINAISLPVPILNFADYLTSPPEIPATLPQNVMAFMSRVISVDPATRTQAIVTQALEEPPVLGAENTVNVFLDIDVIRDGLSIPAHDRETIHTQLQELRLRKNEIFFAHITERTAGMFE